MLFWTFDYKREKKVRGVLGSLEYQKIKISKKYFLKTQYRRDAQKIYNFSPGADNHTFFWLTLYFSKNRKIVVKSVTFEKWFSFLQIYRKLLACIYQWILKLKFLFKGYKSNLFKIYLTSWILFSGWIGWYIEALQENLLFKIKFTKIFSKKLSI